ncbi:MAG: acetate kinase [Epsilonproteobacteria bacterium]|nr:acetate kinase [Campylobacterota bacterium]
MKILTINSGSSSLKVALFEMRDEKRVSFLEVEKIGEDISRVLLEKETVFEGKIEDHYEALKKIEKILNEKNILKNFDQLSAVGHRVVHGGEKFKKSVIIDKKVIKDIKELSSLAPLHNPSNLKGIEAILKKAPSLTQVAVFDTAFHQTMPKKAYLYAIDYKTAQKEKIRRYGFHGTSHMHVAKEGAKILKKELKDLNLITIHLGNGASITAIKNGKSVDTSMGFTPLEGLVMGTRSGDIDPGVLLYLMEKGFEAKEIEELLNKRSGLKGLCGKNDMREIEKIKANSQTASLAFEIFCYRVKKYIGAYMAALGEVEALIFTAGIGENSLEVRERVCENLEIFGIKLDKEKNKRNETIISKKSSKVKVLVIKTDEEIEIARETKRLLLA